MRFGTQSGSADAEPAIDSARSLSIYAVLPEGLYFGSEDQDPHRPPAFPREIDTEGTEVNFPFNYVPIVYCVPGDPEA